MQFNIVQLMLISLMNGINMTLDLPSTDFDQIIGKLDINDMQYLHESTPTKKLFTNLILLRLMDFGHT